MIHADGLQGPDDPLPEIRTRALVSIECTLVLLVLSRRRHSGLVKFCVPGGVEVFGKTPIKCNLVTGSLAQYYECGHRKCFRHQIGRAGHGNSWRPGEIQATGSLCWRPKSYGPGGYFKSPLNASCLFMNAREHRRFPLAIVGALDRSGSMSGTAVAERIKMDLAYLARCRCWICCRDGMIRLVRRDTEPHLIVQL